ncbi:hypothetical protein AVEN_195385-1 [Araneus ventricosus]|uniref:Uncharacterized protein n=1 Tax=Araneus ventricosus TaxID=182803 RepID=A0A4Y2UVD6_ARAVE|nr:hypothetical protein AVEN_195385-1 [Araneus ventricosus]
MAIEGRKNRTMLLFHSLQCKLLATHSRGTLSTRMSCYRISKQELASPGGTAMVGVVLPPSSDNTYLLREWSGRGRLIGYWDSGLSIRAIAAAVIQVTWMLRQGGVRSFLRLPW